MTNFPFHWQQSVLDQHALLAVSIIFAAMGPKFQIFSMGVDPRGFFIDLACHEGMLDGLVLEEVSRRSKELWGEPWPLPETMMGSNLKEFWRYQGQFLRARQPIDSVVEVLSLRGQKELLPGQYLDQRPALMGIVLSKAQRLTKSVKGHADVFWRIQGRALVNHAAAKWCQKHFVVAPETPTSSLSGQELTLLWELERRLQKVLLELSLKGSTLVGHRQDTPPPANSWCWGVPRNSSFLRYDRFWQEPATSGIDFVGQGSWDWAKQKVVRDLREIRQVVTMVCRDTRHLIVCGPLLEQQASSLCGEGDLLVVDPLVQGELISLSLVGYEDFGGWWPLMEGQLTMQGLQWELASRPLISFHRLLGCALLKGIHHED